MFGAADLRFADRLLDDDLGEALRQRRGTERLGRHEIDGAGNLRPQAVGREARDRPNAGLARGEAPPVLGLAGSERGDDAYSRHHHDGAARLIPRGLHMPDPFAQWAASTRAMPSPRQCPTPVTTAWAKGPSIARSTGDSLHGGNNMPWRTARAARAMFIGNCPSMPCSIGSHMRRSASVTAPASRPVRPESTSESRANGSAPRASACWRSSRTRKAPTEAGANPGFDRRDQTG